MILITSHTLIIFNPVIRHTRLAKCIIRVTELTVYNCTSLTAGSCKVHSIVYIALDTFCIVERASETFWISTVPAVVHICQSVIVNALLTIIRICRGAVLAVCVGASCAVWRAGQCVLDLAGCALGWAGWAAYAVWYSACWFACYQQHKNNPQHHHSYRFMTSAYIYMTYIDNLWHEFCLKGFLW